MGEFDVGIYFQSSRHGRCHTVSRLTPGGPAEKSCAVEIGHRIVMINEKDVSTSSLQEVETFLRGPKDSLVNVKFLEMREIRLTMERCVKIENSYSVGIIWKRGEEGLVVSGISPEYYGFGVLPKAGDRLLKIDGESIESMRFDDITMRLAGPLNTSVRLDFARGVAHHTVTLKRELSAPARGLTPSVLDPQIVDLQSNVRLINTQQAHSHAHPGSSSAWEVFDEPEPTPGSRVDQRMVETGRSPAPLTSSFNDTSASSAPSAVTTRPYGSWKTFNELAGLDNREAEKKNTLPPQDRSNEADPRRAMPYSANTHQPAHGYPVLSAPKVPQGIEKGESNAVSNAQLNHLQEENRTLANEKKLLREQLNEMKNNLTNAEQTLSRKEAELNSVKTVLSRRAEAAGETRRQIEDLSATIVSLNEEKTNLALKLDKTSSDLSQARAQIQDLQDLRISERQKLQDDADFQMRRRFDDYTRQIEALNADLHTRDEQVKIAQGKVKELSQALVDEKKSLETSEGQLAVANNEIIRLQQNRAELESSHKDLRSRYEGVVQQLNVQQVKNSELIDAAREQENNMEALKASNEKVLEEIRQQLVAQSDDFMRVKEEMQRLHLQELEDMKEKHQIAIDEIRRAQADADTKAQDYEKRIQEVEVANRSLSAELQEAEASYRENMVDMKERHESELAELQQKLDVTMNKCEKLNEACANFKEQLANAKRTIEAQALSCQEERKCTEDWQQKAEKSQAQVQSLEEELRNTHQLMIQLDISSTRLRLLEQFQQRIQFEAHKKSEQIRQLQGNLPYAQLGGMLQEAHVSLTSLQELAEVREKEVGFYKQKLNELMNAREMGVETEKQLWKYKEQLDWKTIALQQTLDSLSNCQVLMQKHGVPQDEIDKVTSALTVSAQHARPYEETSQALNPGSITITKASYDVNAVAMTSQHDGASKYRSANAAPLLYSGMPPAMSDPRMAQPGGMNLDGYSRPVEGDYHFSSGSYA
mmetsp:Transcript_49057/g.154028  ORF Transcript_49057/g.154028 Transcript_49057/m.154028 type:complete len:991 (-) Transcript_49057:73-3045(-)